MTSHVWQMPQGGVDPGEDTWEAAKRELYEETSVRSVEKLGEVAGLADLRHSAHRCRPRLEGPLSRPAAEMVRGALHRQGQRDQCRQPGGGHKAEFVSWRWEPMKNLPELIVPFKRPVYERVVKEFPARRQLS